MTVAVAWSCPQLDKALNSLLLPTFEQTEWSPEIPTFWVHGQNAAYEIVAPPGAVARMERPVFWETVERMLHLYLAFHAVGAVYIHAGAVLIGGRALILPGRSYSGKSSLCQELVRHGAQLLSDEYAIIDGQAQIHAFPRPVSLRTAQGDIRQECTEFGYPGPGPWPIAACAFLRYQAGANFSPTIVPAGTSILEMMRFTVSATKNPHTVLATLAALSQSIVSWEGDRGEAKACATSLLKLL